jgi:tRNA pseudouridine55 synthase
MYSAKKIGGKALYKMARAGQEIERKAVRVRADLSLADRVARNDDGSVDVDVRVVCSAGTYVRTLAHDLGARLGCGAHLEALRRVRVGRFRIDEASTLEALEGRVAERLVAPERLVADLATVVVDETEAKRVAHGNALARELDAPDGADCRVLGPDGALLAVAAYDAAAQVVRPRAVFTAPE